MTEQLKEPLLSVQDLRVSFKVPGRSPSGAKKKQLLHAVDGISFDVYPGEILGVVGESGCGKSTLGRAILGLIPASGGRVLYSGENLLALNKKQWIDKRRELQIIFQDPFASLNPRLTVREIISEPLHSFYSHWSSQQIREKVIETMSRVGLDPSYINHYPHEISGGQSQRVGIARALILEPRLIICDEPVSALDISIQAQILNLLKDLQKESGFSLIFISHNLSVVRYICDRVVVMYLGQMLECAETERLFENPRHPYTQLLLAAIPTLDSAKQQKTAARWLGDIPSPLNKPSGCVFHTRCPIAIENCKHEVPPLKSLRSGAQVACLMVDDED